MGQVPGIVFRDGPAGRRAGVAGSLDVWEIIEAVQAADHTTPEAVGAGLAVPVRIVLVALDYYARYPDEIDQWIADNNHEAAQAHAAWLNRQSALA